MSIIAVNVIKVLFVAALYGFLFYVARAMRGHLSGPPIDTAVPQPPSRRRTTDDTPPPPRPTRSIVILDADGLPTDHPLHGTVVVGRAASADIQLADEYASEHHASFTVIADGVAVEDLGSTNGTTIDGERIEGRIEVAPGTTVVVGRTKVVIR